jgi:hypothetical protein
VRKEVRRRALNGDLSPEQVQRKLTMLALQREVLRESGSSRESMELNRLEIGRCQYELSHALIRRHLAPPRLQAA